MSTYLLSTGAQGLLAHIVQTGGALTCTNMDGHERWGFVNSPEEGRRGRVGFQIDGLGHAPELREHGCIEMSDEGDLKMYTVSEKGQDTHAVPF